MTTFVIQARDGEAEMPRRSPTNAPRRSCMRHYTPVNTKCAPRSLCRWCTAYPMTCRTCKRSFYPPVKAPQPPAHGTTKPSCKQTPQPTVLPAQHPFDHTSKDPFRACVCEIECFSASTEMDWARDNAWLSDQGTDLERIFTYAPGTALAVKIVKSNGVCSCFD